MDIYEKLDFYRKRAGLTNQQMANKLGYAYDSGYRMAICRKSHISLNTLKKMIDILSLSDEEILDLFK